MLMRPVLPLSRSHRLWDQEERSVRHALCFEVFLLRKYMVFLALPQSEYLIISVAHALNLIAKFC